MRARPQLGTCSIIKCMRSKLPPLLDKLLCFLILLHVTVAVRSTQQGDVTADIRHPVLAPLELQHHLPHVPAAPACLDNRHVLAIAPHVVRVRSPRDVGLLVTAAAIVPRAWVVECWRGFGVWPQECVAVPANDKIQARDGGSGHQIGCVPAPKWRCTCVCTLTQAWGGWEQTKPTLRGYMHFTDRQCRACLAVVVSAPSSW